MGRSLVGCSFPDSKVCLKVWRGMLASNNPLTSLIEDLGNCSKMSKLDVEALKLWWKKVVFIPQTRKL
ncbi:hypothetical protein L1987_85784 [Smallanthus sonchifolius]|uniref:Uncharacterized protein n=1 Tax=Smallanthus sonchifolius TaxID=185202 RepID=A0ACB8XY52_9ASTR|nr:hypothetical protein L1987_85784 [Smallanthus sonchifolius]